MYCIYVCLKSKCKLLSTKFCIAIYIYFIFQTGVNFHFRVTDNGPSPTPLHLWVSTDFPPKTINKHYFSCARKSIAKYSHVKSLKKVLDKIFSKQS